jgi:hypothetical protein
MALQNIYKSVYQKHAIALSSQQIMKYAEKKICFHVPIPSLLFFNYKMTKKKVDVATESLKWLAILALIWSKFDLLQKGIKIGGQKCYFKIYWVKITIF